MIKRIRVFSNRRERDHEDIKRMLAKTGIEYRLIPTTGVYTLHLFDETGNSRGAYGPTAVKYALKSLLEKRVDG